MPQSLKTLCLIHFLPLWVNIFIDRRGVINRIKRRYVPAVAVQESKRSRTRKARALVAVPVNWRLRLANKDVAYLSFLQFAVRGSCMKTKWPGNVPWWSTKKSETKINVEWGYLISLSTPWIKMCATSTLSTVHEFYLAAREDLVKKRMVRKLHSA